MHHWGIVLDEITKMLDDPIVLGLTATPPDLDGVDEFKLIRYSEYFGEVDYEVPVPALVEMKILHPIRTSCIFPAQRRRRWNTLLALQSNFNNSLKR